MIMIMIMITKMTERKTIMITMMMIVASEI